MSQPTHTRPVAPRPALGTSTWLGRRLAILGGMRADLVDEFPGERRSYIQVALSLSVTALVAAMGGALALSVTFARPDGTGPSVAVLVIGGLVSGVVLFTVNRQLVLSLEGRRRVDAVIPGIVGLLISALIGVVMSTPLVLQLFGSEIRAEIAIMNNETANAGREGTLMPPLREAVERAQDEVDAQMRALQVARSGTNVEKNPVYVDAMKAWTAATKACTAAQTNATLDFRGKLRPPEGSERPGGGSLYRNLQNQANQRCSFAVEKKTDLSRAKKAATVTPEHVQANIKRAEEDLANAKAELERVTQQLTDAEERIRGSAEGYGLLIRLQALERILHNGGFLGWLTYVAIIALFASIQLLAVLIAFLGRWAPQPSAYEQACAVQDQTALRTVALGGARV